MALGVGVTRRVGQGWNSKVVGMDSIFVGVPRLRIEVPSVSSPETSLVDQYEKDRGSEDISLTQD